MNVLNLGAGGFIGAHLTQRLLSEGYCVNGVDTHTDKIEEFLTHPNFTFHKKDIRQLDNELNDLINNSDLVIDLIAHANPGIYVKSPIEVFQVNFYENLRIAERCIQKKKRLIQFSSCEVYGKTPVAVLSDRLSDPEDPYYATFSEEGSNFILGPVSKHRWIYACAKQLLERVLHAYGLEGKLNYTIIRPFNYIGPKIDYLPHKTEGMPRVFSFFMEALINGTPMKLVNGGTQRRCYTYIDDAIECIVRVVRNPGNVCDNQIFNVGSPQNEVTIRGLAECMREIYVEKFKKSGISLPEIVEVSGDEFYGEGYEDSDRRIPDIAKARTLLEWEPKCCLRELLELTMAYYIKD